jgi:hypothetical protein
MMRVSAYALAGDTSTAEEALSDLHKLLPSFKHYSVQSYGRRLSFKREKDLALFEEGMRKADVPDRPK